MGGMGVASWLWHLRRRSLVYRAGWLHPPSLLAELYELCNVYYLSPVLSREATSQRMG